MKKILRIAQSELNALFYSPIAWVLLLIFVFHSGYIFLDTISNLQRAVYLGRTDLHNFTRLLFSSEGGGIFQTVKSNLYLYIPLLTMGLISREVNSGSIKLLLSSPVRNREIVLGKLFAMMVYGLILIGILLIFTIIAAFYVPSLDIKMILAGMLGLYLLLCTYASIGLFISSLSSYQIIVAICTLVVLTFLNYVGQIGQKIDFIRDITYFLSMAWRVDYFLFGLISTKHILYFVLITILFTGFTIIKLQAGRESAPLYIKTGRYAALMAGVLFLGYISSRPRLIAYYDATATKEFTLTRNSQEMLSRIKGPVTISTYDNVNDMYAFYYAIPEHVNEDMSRFEDYTRFLPDINMKYVYYYDKAPNPTAYKRNKGLDDAGLAKKIAGSYDLDFEMFLPPAQMRKIIDLEPEKYSFVRQITYNGKSTFLRIYNDQERFPSEKEVVAAFSRLLVKVPVIGFLNGNGERLIKSKRDEGYNFATSEKTFRYSLINQGFDVKVIEAGQAIPDDISALVVADPSESLDSSTTNKLNRYIASGGNILFAAEPGRAAVLNPILKNLGVQVSSDTLIEKTEDFAPDLIFANVTRAARDLDTSLAPLTEKQRISMNGVGALTYSDSNGYKIEPVLVNKSGLPLGIALTKNTGNRQQRIMVTGDADFMNNVELGRFMTGNFYFYPGVFKWLSNSMFPIDVSRPPAPDNKLVIQKKQIGMLKILLLAALPAVVLITGAVILIRRARN